jgi:hypothetical protein
MNTQKKIIHHLYNQKEEKQNPPSANSKPQLKIVDSQYEKMEIERFKKLISEKIKDPKMAKKAALIISELINKKD